MPATYGTTLTEVNNVPEVYEEEEGHGEEVMYVVVVEDGSGQWADYIKSKVPAQVARMAEAWEKTSASLPGYKIKVYEIKEVDFKDAKFLTK